MKKNNLISMNAGKSLRMLMEKNNVSCDALEKALGVSATTVSKLRKKILMSGKNVCTLAAYFNISCSEFISIGEE